MKKLLMISLGGKVQGANIEVHDLQFVIAENIEEAIDLVKEQWYGSAFKLHMDSYKELTGADGYEITVSNQKQEQKESLYFVHLGGYLEKSTQEFHDIRLFVAENEKEAKVRAGADKSFDYIDRHVDSVVKVSEVLHSKGQEKYRLMLKKSDEKNDLTPDWFGYRRLDQ